MFSLCHSSEGDLFIICRNYGILSNIESNFCFPVAFWDPCVQGKGPVAIQSQQGNKVNDVKNGSIILQKNAGRIKQWHFGIQ